MLKKYREMSWPVNWMGKNGVSLIEFLIVIALIGVFSFLALPYFKPLLRYANLKRDGWKLLSDLRWYRQLAIIEHMNYKFDFDVSSDSYNVEQHDAGTDAYIKTVATVALNNDLTAATDTTFGPKGNATAGSTITVKNKAFLDTLTITVYATTGLAKMAK